MQQIQCSRAEISFFDFEVWILNLECRSEKVWVRNVQLEMQCSSLYNALGFECSKQIFCKKAGRFNEEGCIDDRHGQRKSLYIVKQVHSWLDGEGVWVQRPNLWSWGLYFPPLNIPPLRCDLPFFVIGGICFDFDLSLFPFTAFWPAWAYSTPPLHLYLSF